MSSITPYSHQQSEEALFNRMALLETNTFTDLAEDALWFREKFWNARPVCLNLPQHTLGALGEVVQATMGIFYLTVGVIAVIDDPSSPLTHYIMLPLCCFSSFYSSQALYFLFKKIIKRTQSEDELLVIENLPLACKNTFSHFRNGQLEKSYTVECHSLDQGYRAVDLIRKVTARAYYDRESPLTWLNRGVEVAKDHPDWDLLTASSAIFIRTALVPAENAIQEPWDVDKTIQRISFLEKRVLRQLGQDLRWLQNHFLHPKPYALGIKWVHVRLLATVATNAAAVWMLYFMTRSYYFEGDKKGELDWTPSFIPFKLAVSFGMMMALMNYNSCVQIARWSFNRCKKLRTIERAEDGWAFRIAAAETAVSNLEQTFGQNPDQDLFYRREKISRFSMTVSKEMRRVTHLIYFARHNNFYASIHKERIKTSSAWDRLLQQIDSLTESIDLLIH